MAKNRRDSQKHLFRYALMAMLCVALAGAGIRPDDVSVFTERSAQAGSMKVEKGSELIKRLLEI